MHLPPASLVIATLVQGFVLVWLVPLSTPSQGVVLAGVILVVLALGAWRARLAQRPLVGLLGRLEALAPAAPESAPRASIGEGEGELERAVLFVHERVSEALSETRRLRSQAEDAGVYRTAFLRAVAHELRTPLNAILGFTDVLLSGIEGPLSEDRRENLDVLRASSQKLLAMFNDAIELSTMASGQLSLRRERADLGALLEEAIAELERQRQAASNPRPVHFAIEMQEPLPQVSVQRNRIVRVLEIVGAYALARTEAGSVRFVVSDLADAVMIEVRDDGEMIPVAEHRALFAPELASDSEARRDSLRLSIARQLAHLHGGALDAPRQMGGARFVLRLPHHLSEPPHV